MTLGSYSSTDNLSSNFSHFQCSDDLSESSFSSTAIGNDSFFGVSGDMNGSFFHSNNTCFSLAYEQSDGLPFFDIELLKRSFQDKNFNFAKFQADRPIEAYYTNRIRAYKIFLERQKHRDLLGHVVQS